MFKKKDEEFLQERNIYNLALEKYFNPTIYKNSKHNRTMAKAYVISNENQEKTFSLLSNTPKKRALVVGSSGDQLLNAVLNGAEDATLIDGNLYARYFTEYKIAAIKNLNFENFTNNFLEPTKMFSHEIYQKLFLDLSPDAQSFFGTIFQLDSPWHTYLRLFGEPYYDYFGSSYYKDEQAFIKLKEKLKSTNITYIDAKFKDFPTKVQGKYDLIMLSNIFDYTRNGKFKHIVNQLYTNNLNTGGQIQIQYDLDVRWNMKDVALIPDLFRGKHCKVHYFKSTTNNYDEETTLQAVCLLSKPRENEPNYPDKIYELE